MHDNSAFSFPIDLWLDGTRLAKVQPLKIISTKLSNTCNEEKVQYLLSEVTKSKL